MNGPTAPAIVAGDTEIATAPLERTSGPEIAPLYEIRDRRCGGERRVVAQTSDPLEVRYIVALLRWAGALDVEVELIPLPVIP